MGSFTANAFGLHEVLGNLWEWCLDGFDSGFYSSSPEVDPVSPWESAALRLPRGGGFDFPAINARSANRARISPSYAGYAIGVRPARAITE